MVTIMVLVGGSTTLGLAVAAAFGRRAAQADVAHEAAFVRYVYEMGLEHRFYQALDDAAAGDVTAPVASPDPRAPAVVPSSTGQAWA